MPEATLRSDIFPSSSAIDPKRHPHCLFWPPHQNFAEKEIISLKIEIRFHYCSGKTTNNYKGEHMIKPLVDLKIIDETSYKAPTPERPMMNGMDCACGSGDTGSACGSACSGCACGSHCNSCNSCSSGTGHSAEGAVLRLG